MKRAKLQRERITKLIAGEIRRAARAGDEQFIRDLLCHGVGWLSNFTRRSCKDKARGLLALLPLASAEDFAHVADMTINRRARLCGAAPGNAREVARHILQPLGVRYAACGCLAHTCCDCAARAA